MPILFTGCAHQGPRGIPTSQGAIQLDGVPFHPQEAYQCGPAALATVLGWSGLPVSPETLVDDVFLPARQGSLQAEMLAAPARHGRLALRLPAEPEAIIDELKAGHPVLILQNLSLAVLPTWHYAVVVGFDPAMDEVTLRSGRYREHVIKWRTLQATWARADRWAMVVLKPGELPANAAPAEYAEAALTLERVQNDEAAAQAYAAGLTRWPNELRLPFGLANVRYRLGDLAGAEQALRMALQIEPDSVPVLNNLAQVLTEQGCASLAIRYAERALTKAGEWSGQVEGTLNEARKALDEGAVCRPQATQGV